MFRGFKFETQHPEGVVQAESGGEPVFQLEAFHLRKMLLVIGDKRSVNYKGMGSDHRINKSDFPRLSSIANKSGRSARKSSPTGSSQPRNKSGRSARKSSPTGFFIQSQPGLAYGFQDQFLTHFPHGQFSHSLKSKILRNANGLATTIFKDFCSGHGHLLY